MRDRCGEAMIGGYYTSLHGGLGIILFGVVGLAVITWRTKEVWKRDR